MLIRQAICSIFLFTLAINFVSFNDFVIAQPSNDSGQPSPNSAQPSPDSAPPIRRSPPAQPEEDQRTKGIKDQIIQNKQVKIMCSNYFKNITFESLSDSLRVDTGNNLCAYTIIKEVLEPQLKTGKIRTYEYTGDREGVIVSF